MENACISLFGLRTKDENKTYWSRNNLHVSVKNTIHLVEVSSHCIISRCLLEQYTISIGVWPLFWASGWEGVVHSPHAEALVRWCGQQHRRWRWNAPVENWTDGVLGNLFINNFKSAIHASIHVHIFFCNYIIWRSSSPLEGCKPFVKTNYKIY